MANLVLGLAGAAIGGFVTGGIFTAAGALSFGANVGWLAGSAIGDVIVGANAHNDREIPPADTIEISSNDID